jgi:hypothetical protein
MKQTNNQKKPGLKKILIPIGVVATAVGGFFGWRWWTSNKNQSLTDEIANESYSLPASSASNVPTANSSNTSYRADHFPLKKGSKGERVKTLQRMLISKYGSGILPKYGADGDFGSEMQNALQSKGLPVTIDENAFNALTAGITVDLNAVASSLIKSLTAKNFSDTLSNVKRIENSKDYQLLNEKFRVINLNTSKSLARYILETFPIAAQQDALRVEFLRLGLKFDGYEWTLSGTPDRSLLITTEPTQLIDLKSRVKVSVPKGMIIGYQLQNKNGYTLFKTIEKNKKLIVKSDSIKIYERD